MEIVNAGQSVVHVLPAAEPNALSMTEISVAYSCRLAFWLVSVVVARLTR